MKRATPTPDPQHAPAAMQKVRTLLFAKLPPGQIAEAAAFLAAQENVSLTLHAEHDTIKIAYDLRDYSLESLETALVAEGFHLENTLLVEVMRALIYYLEETQRHNLGAPKRLLKKSQITAYSHAWENRPHGDHDDTPPEWRKYK